MTSFRRLLLSGLCLLAVVAPTQAQVQTGSILGVVSDDSNAVMPGVTVTLTGEGLIGGPQTAISDTAGAYRFDRLPPGTYNVKFELQGFKVVERADVRINAAFVATVNAKLEVGNLSETITVTGESPTVDTRSTLQQTVMDQAVLEGVPTGRDPWSLAKLIPGVQVATYDVGGTQSIQQSSLSAHGSNTADVNYNIDGAVVNWPGGGGGATMLYYDQGMFEEVNYMTSAIPAEVMAGGVSINMVTKSGSNTWRGNLKYSFANDDLQAENHTEIDDQFPTFLGNPTQKTYDVNLSGGGALVQNRLWVNGTIRRWVVNKLTNARNDDGTQALDDNTLKNYSGKVVAQLTTNQRLMASYLWNNKIRGHRRDTPPDLVPDIAALVQTNPASSTQLKYTNVMNRLVFESNFSVMDGLTEYSYQPDTPADAIRLVDTPANRAANAATRHERQPNQRLQFDNIASYSKSGWGGEHLFKAGVQFARLSYQSEVDIQGDHYVEYSNGVPSQIRLFNTPLVGKNLERVLGVFFQDAWTIGNRLTLNVGMRYDHNTGILPEQSNPDGRFIAARSIDETTVVKQNLAVWRAGASYDLLGTGNTAIKASYSRYGLQVGIDRVTAVNPFFFSSNGSTCPWSDPNGNGRFDAGEVTFSQCSGFASVSTRYADSNGPDWPYSDEVTVGFEHQLIKDMRVGAMYYYRTNRDQLGTRNRAVPSSAYTPVTINVPNGPGGTVASPAPTTVTLYNLNSTSLGLQDNFVDNDPYLDTEYKGVEFTATKRFSSRWQMVAGLTIGSNRGGVNAFGQATQNSGQSSTNDLNDPNFVAFDDGIIGNDSKVAFRLSGSYVLPWDINIAGSMLSNGGYPFVSTYVLTRALAAQQGVTLTRATQTLFLSERGDERMPTVTMVDLKFSRDFRFGSRRIAPYLDIFNISNASTLVRDNNGVSSSYRAPAEIVAPRIIRVGFSIDF
jgi:hypothetical protein